MKKLKKMMALVLAVAMCLAMSMTTTVMSFAAGEITISMDIDATDTHQYKVYQIFTGDLASDGKTLSNVKYGANYGDTGTLVPKTVLDNITDADAFARTIAGSLKGDIVGTLKADTTSVTVPATGYYLIVDDTTKPLEDGDAYSAYIVKVVKSVEVAPKKDTTSVDKKITTDTLGKDDATTTVNGIVDNVSIGDTVNFQIDGTVPSHATDYDYYFYIIGDTLTEGLTFNSTSVKVYKESVSDANLLNKPGTPADYALYTGTAADGKTFQVALTDAKSLAGKKIIVVYSATLNDKAKIGELSNDNTVTIQYSNNPNHNYNGDKDNNTPGKPAEESHSPLGETPESKTHTYTTAIQIQKVDENGKVLTGAEFTLTGDNEEIVLVSSETFAEAADGTYYKLNNDSYTTEEPVTADYMKPAAAGATEGYVEDAGYTGEDKVVVGSKTYRPYKAEDAGKTVYILVKANADEYDDTTKKYSKSVTYTQKDTNTSGVTATAEVGPDGVVEFRGLGKGTYTITESKTPNGYNTIDPIDVTINFTANPNGTTPHWSTTSDSKATYNSTTGVFEVTIENQKGTELPSTGGMGTTIFYIAGAILVIGAVVLLIARKKAER